MENINLQYEPHFYQRKFHKYAHPDNPAYFVTQVAGRQSGKTLSTEIQAIYYAFHATNTLVWYVSPSDSQSKKIYNDIYGMLEGTGLITRSNNTQGVRTIYLLNKSRIEFKSAKAKNTLRGESVEYLILDEAAFIDEDVVYNILLPTMNVKGKKVVLSSTPRGKNFLWQLWHKAKVNSNYKSLRYTTFQNPHRNDEIIRTLKEQLPEQQYKQEILAHFVDKGSVFTGFKELATINPATPAKENLGTYNFVGIDIGMLNDETAIVVINDNNQMVCNKHFQVNSTEYIKQQIRDVFHKYNPVAGYMELNNQGLPIYNDLEKELKALKGFTTTSTSKQQIINELIAAVNKKEIALLQDPHLHRQLEDFSFKVTSSGNLQFTAVVGHDDIVMALAIAWHCKTQEQFAVDVSASDIIRGFDI